MPLLIDVAADDRASTPAASVSPSATRTPTVRVRPRPTIAAPAKRFPAAWIISIALHGVVGLWIADAVRDMLAENRAPVDTGITLRCLPYVAAREMSDEPLSFSSPATVLDDADLESDTLAPPSIDPTPPSAEEDAGSVTILMGSEQVGAPLSSLEPGDLRPHRRSGQPAPSDQGDEAPALFDAGPPMTPAVPAGPPPRLLEAPEPRYPLAARRAGHAGTVAIALSIREDGTVAEVHVQSSSGHESLDEAALAAVRHWRFDPGVDGRSSTVRIVFVVR